MWSWIVHVNFWSHNNEFMSYKKNPLIKISVLNLLHYWHLVFSGFAIKLYLEMSKCQKSKIKIDQFPKFSKQTNTNQSHQLWSHSHRYEVKFDSKKWTLKNQQLQFQTRTTKFVFSGYSWMLTIINVWIH